MASNFSISTVLLLITFDLVTAVPEREYYSMLAALRFRGYHLFANAITTTDLHYDIIDGSNFTFFAPLDSALYALDMSMTASDYTMALRFHGVPHRLTLPDLRLLPYGSNCFPTLVRGHDIHIVNRLPLPLPIMVEGVDIAFPGLFYDTHIAVHGLEGIIDFRSLTDTGNSSSNLQGDMTSNSNSTDHTFQSITTNLTNDHSTPIALRRQSSPSPSPQPPFNSTANHTDFVSVAAQPPLSTNSTAAPSPVPAPQALLVSSTDITPETHVISIPVITRDRQPVTSSESTTQGREEHMSMSTGSRLISGKINDVSLATKLSSNGVEEFTEVDDKIIDCPIMDDDGKQLSIANIRHGYLYTRELYTPSNMSCAHE